MNDGATTTAENGNIRYNITNSLTLGYIETSGDVSLIASTIRDSATAGDDVIDINANQLRIKTGDSGAVAQVKRICGG